MPRNESIEEDFQLATGTRASDQLLAKLRNLKSVSIQSKTPGTSPKVAINELDSKNNGSSKLTVTLNTRIPQELSEKIDDFIYFCKKRGERETKQSLTIKAIGLFFQTHEN